MATTSFTASPTNSSAANFRAWASALNTAITTVGLIDTAATGQIDLTTVAAPGAANTFMGYKVYRFDDALQATYPAFLKVEFGSSNTAAATPAIRVTLGTAHDGSGNITGTQTSGALQVGSQASSATACQCWASGSTNRLALAMFAENSAVNSQLCFLLGVERTVDSSGAVNTDGLVLETCGYTNSSNSGAGIRTLVVPPSGGIPAVERRWMMPFSATQSGSSEFGSEVAMGLLIPFAGRALRPVRNWGAIGATDIPVYAATITPTIYGASSTYIALGTAQALNQATEVTGSNITSTPNNPVRLLMRYE